MTLVGWSWGAWLGFILAARHPALVRKLVLVGSGPFEEAYAAGIMDIRLARLDPVEREEALGLMHSIEDENLPDRKVPFRPVRSLDGPGRFLSPQAT